MEEDKPISLRFFLKQDGIAFPSIRLASFDLCVKSATSLAIADSLEIVFQLLEDQKVRYLAPK